MSSTIEVRKSIVCKNCVCYTILVSDIYDKIGDVNGDVTVEIRLCFMRKYLNIFLLDQNIMFELTDGIQTVNNSEKVEVDSWWIKLSWESCLKQHELIKDKLLLSCGRPEIINDLINSSVNLIDEKKYLETIELLTTGLKYRNDINFNILAYNMSCAYSLLKDEENMFLYLNMAIESGYKNWKQAKTDVDFEEYHNNPQFISTVEKMRQNSKNEDVTVQLSSC